MNVREKVQNGDYDTKLPYPKSATKPRLPAGHSAEEAAAYAAELKEWENYRGVYAEQKSAWHQDEARLTAQFKLDLLAELGIAEHPKADLLYEMAWERGHSGGLIEVLQVAEDLSDLLT